MPANETEWLRNEITRLNQLIDVLLTANQQLQQQVKEPSGKTSSLPVAGIDSTFGNLVTPISDIKFTPGNSDIQIASNQLTLGNIPAKISDNHLIPGNFEDEYFRQSVSTRKNRNTKLTV